MRVGSAEIGIMGTGSNFFRCGLTHSTGVVYIGTYGPQPAIVWKVDPRTESLEQIGAPGEYQLDCMVEAPNGVVYIGTAYSAFVYRLDPRTDEISCLGSPPIDSTSWIFTMICTRDGRIFGAKGVGLFQLHWETDRLEAIGLVPGNHATPGPNASNPIIRQLQEAPDGTIWGDTNRWLFRFDPTTRGIEPLVDMLGVDPACYALFLPQGPEPTNDCHFAIYSRFSGEAIAHPFYVYRSATRALDALPIDGWEGTVVGHPEWWTVEGKHCLIVPTWHDGDHRLRMSVVDPSAQKLLGRWEFDSNVVGTAKLAGHGPYFLSTNRGQLLQAEPQKQRLVTVAENPTPVECRCLAISPQRVLGTDTNDCGYAFSRNLETGEIRDHGKVWRDDHRANYGPAAFAGTDGRYLLANHSQGMPALWVTDTQVNRHWRVGDAAIQLVPMEDGTVWGTTGPNPSTLEFDPRASWQPSWHVRGGKLFRYRPGEKRVDLFDQVGLVGPIAEAPKRGRVVIAGGQLARVLDPAQGAVVAELGLPAGALAAAHDRRRHLTYLVLEDGMLYALCEPGRDGPFELSRRARFGPTERGFFVLSHSGKVVGIAASGLATVYDPSSGSVQACDGPVPLPAGPAIDPEHDVWYYADRSVVAYRLVSQ